MFISSTRQFLCPHVRVNILIASLNIFIGPVFVCYIEQVHIKQNVISISTFYSSYRVNLIITMDLDLNYFYQSFYSLTWCIAINKCLYNKLNQGTIIAGDIYRTFVKKEITNGDANYIVIKQTKMLLYDLC